MTDWNNDFISRLTQAARDNPLAAALIGGGALWLMLGDRMVGSAASGMAAGARSVADAGMQGFSQAAESVSSTSARGFDRAADGLWAARDAASGAADTMKQGVSGMVERAGATLSEAAETARAAMPDPVPLARSTYRGAQSALSDLLERQPLVIGAIGLAIGAGVGAALASTSVENEWAGPISDEVKTLVKDRTEAVVDTAQRAAGELGDEFRAAASETAGKLRETGAKAAKSLASTTS